MCGAKGTIKNTWRPRVGRTMWRKMCARIFAGFIVVLSVGNKLCVCVPHLPIFNLHQVRTQIHWARFVHKISNLVRFVLFFSVIFIVHLDQFSHFCCILQAYSFVLLCGSRSNSNARFGFFFLTKWRVLSSSDTKEKNNFLKNPFFIFIIFAPVLWWTRTAPLVQNHISDLVCCYEFNAATEIT